MNQIEKKRWYQARPWLNAPIQTAFCGFILVTLQVFELL